MRNINNTRIERSTKKRHDVDDYLKIGERRKLCQKLGLSEGQFVAYTDGSCWNQDPFHCGGAAYVVLDHEGNISRARHKGFRGTTNNRMEMLAIISAVASVPHGSDLIVFSDSQYAMRAFKFGGTKNYDLIRLFRNKSRNLNSVRQMWVRGHNGTPLNEWCDYWANYEYKTEKEKLAEHD